MASSKKVYVEHLDHGIAEMFLNEGWSLSDSVFSADLICLCGGADVSPEIYHQKNTHSETSEQHDIHSFGLFFLAKRLGKPIVGICRGSQVLNVALGGQMIQHIEGHTQEHEIYNVVDGEGVRVVCGHHQASILSPELLSKTDTVYKKDGVMEVFLSTKEGVLGFQPHPEWANKNHESRELFFSLIEELMLSCR